jgi:hypothetical protein
MTGSQHDQNRRTILLLLGEKAGMPARRSSERRAGGRTVPTTLFGPMKSFSLTQPPGESFASCAPQRQTLPPLLLPPDSRTASRARTMAQESKEDSPSPRGRDGVRASVAPLGFDPLEHSPHYFTASSSDAYNPAKAEARGPAIHRRWCRECFARCAANLNSRIAIL